MENSGESVQKSPRGRPRFPERQGLEGLTPVEYRRIYQASKPRRDASRTASDTGAQSDACRATSDGPRRGRPSHNLSEKEKKVRVRQYRNRYYHRHREHCIEQVKKYQTRKREETASKIKHLENLVSLYNVVNAIRGNKQDVPREGADKV